MFHILSFEILSIYVSRSLLFLLSTYPICLSVCLSVKLSLTIFPHYMNFPLPFLFVTFLPQSAFFPFHLLSVFLFSPRFSSSPSLPTSLSLSPSPSLSLSLYIYIYIYFKIDLSANHFLRFTIHHTPHFICLLDFYFSLSLSLSKKNLHSLSPSPFSFSLTLDLFSFSWPLTPFTISPSLRLLSLKYPSLFLCLPLSLFLYTHTHTHTHTQTQECSWKVGYDILV